MAIEDEPPRSTARAAKAIQDKPDRLDQAFLFERSIDIERYDRHAEKLREELTLVRTTAPAFSYLRPIQAGNERLVVRHVTPFAGLQDSR